ncbi:MAG: AzlC family ABC transporter permease, partial [Clostridia bacterium]|nr:AzlC family ABC transporter permease [Clostridia bacterium]
MQATQLGETPRQQFLRGLRDGVPIGLGYLSVSFAFGITAVSRGVPAWIALLISMTNMTSAGQLA